MYNLFVVYHKQKTKRQEVALENISTEETEKGLEPQNSLPQEGEDIEFDENVNIEDIQKILQQHMDETAAAEEAAAESTEDPTEESQEEILEIDEDNEEAKQEEPIEEVEDEEDNEEAQERNRQASAMIESFISNEVMAQIATQVNQEVATEVDAQAKKYVIYIDPENIEFIEHLSIAERKSVINKILKEQDNLVKKQKREQEIKTYLRHAIVATITIIIGLPILYVLVNKSLEATIANYRQSEKNFSILFKEQGRTNQRNNSLDANIKY